MKKDEILVENLRLAVGEPEEALLKVITNRLGIDTDVVKDLEIRRRALDARKRHEIHWLFNVSLRIEDAAIRDRLLGKKLARIPQWRPKDAADLQILDGVPHGEKPLIHPPVIIGSGPGGLFAAWLLAREGYRPILLERGPEIRSRVRDVRVFDKGGEHHPESNILHGEGGAGTFSDGKLTTRMRSPLVGLVHEILVAARAPANIQVDSKPHIGTDRLRAVIVYLRRELQRMGVVFRFGAKMTGLELDLNGGVRGVRLEGGEVIATSSVMLAIGHSARDTYTALHEQGIGLEFKDFQMGLRIEHPQAMIDHILFGSFAGRLPSAEYSINDKRSGVFSFCMCPGGSIVAGISEAGHLCSNGMSRRSRDSGWAGSGLVFTIPAELTPGGGRHPLAGIELQRKVEKRAFEIGGETYALPAQRAQDYVKGRISGGSLTSSYSRGLVSADLREVLPDRTATAIRHALEIFDRRIPGYLSEGVLVGPESRGSSPTRIPRDSTTRVSTTTPGLYPVGEGAGYAGGIMSAAIDGLRSAAALIQAAGPS
ncbi:MAG: NAD(P)-binding protein [Thermoanaerobaculales bacterium]|nr:NAD(P)-binding protein [Thermoanaerobaculales bacterium]